VLRLAWYTADSIRRFDSKTNRTAYSIRDSIRTKKRFAGPYKKLYLLEEIYAYVNVNDATIFNDIDDNLDCGFVVNNFQENMCHQTSDFKAKMHQIRFSRGFHPRPLWGLSAFSRAWCKKEPAVFSGLLLRTGTGAEGKGRSDEEEKRRRKGGSGGEEGEGHLFNLTLSNDGEWPYIISRPCLRPRYWYSVASVCRLVVKLPIHYKTALYFNALVYIFVYYCVLLFYCIAINKMGRN